MQPFSCIKRQKSARADTSVCILPGQCLFGSDLIPLNFVCFYMKFKAAAIASVNHRILWLIGIIYHTVFAVFHVCMNFHVIVCGIPAVQLLLLQRQTRELHGKSITAVLKAVRQSADVDAAAFSEGISPPSVPPGLSGPESVVPGSANTFFLPSPKSIGHRLQSCKNKVIPVLFSSCTYPYSELKPRSSSTPSTSSSWKYLPCH